MDEIRADLQEKHVWYGTSYGLFPRIRSDTANKSHNLHFRESQLDTWLYATSTLLLGNETDNKIPGG